MPVMLKQRGEMGTRQSYIQCAVIDSQAWSVQCQSGLTGANMRKWQGKRRLPNKVGGKSGNSTKQYAKSLPETPHVFLRPGNMN